MRLLLPATICVTLSAGCSTVKPDAGHEQRKLAEDQRKDAESARAAADNAYRQSMQLSPDQFLRLEAIKMQREVCGRQGACTFLPGADATPVFNVK